MSCEDTQELLPWWRNGSLDNGERAAVEEHLATCADCRAALEQVEEVLAGVAGSSHPAADELVRFAWAGEGERAGAVAEHLEACPSCREAVALARESAELQKLDSPPAPPPANDSGTRAGGRSGALLVAAALLALLFGAQHVRLQQRLAELERPHLDAVVLDLYSDQRTERSRQDPWQEAPVIEPNRQLSLLLQPEAPAPRYEVRIRTEGGRELHFEEAVLPSDAGDLVVALAPGSLPPAR